MLKQNRLSQEGSKESNVILSHCWCVFDGERNSIISRTCFLIVKFWFAVLQSFINVSNRVSGGEKGYIQNGLNSYEVLCTLQPSHPKVSPNQVLNHIHYSIQTQYDPILKCILGKFTIKVNIC